MPFEGRGDGFLENLKDPTAPQPLLFLPMIVGDKMILALLDSGASDSFISADVVKILGLMAHPLLQPLTVRVANGEGLSVTHFVSLSGRLGPMPVRLHLRVINTTIPIVLGYPFIAKFQPLVDWKNRRIRVTRKGKMFDIPALAVADSFRMTCPVEEVPREAVTAILAGVEVQEQKRDDSREPSVEAVPTKDDKEAVAKLQEPKWKTRKRLKVSPRKAVEKLISKVDHTLCGPPCEETPTPECVAKLNKEYERLFPAKVPGG
jgi:hypothetical protein